MRVRLFQEADAPAWDAYVLQHPAATHCHLCGWKEILEETYHHRGYYLISEDGSRITGLLPLFHLKSLLFGNRLVSLPFLNYGGLISDGDSAGHLLLEKAFQLARTLRVEGIELRQLSPLAILGSHQPLESPGKMRMALPLPSTPEELWQGLRSKLRSQIRRPQKEGLEAKVGGGELVNDFYRVFALNMRDLGSPVHAKSLFRNLSRTFAAYLDWGVVYRGEEAVAAGVLFRFKGLAEIPWASSLRKFNPLSPNMLLYWSLMGHACGRGISLFDFGRCRIGEGTYRFKEQWGARPERLHWSYLPLRGRPRDWDLRGNGQYAALSRCWGKLPIWLANRLGPVVRRRIAL